MQHNKHTIALEITIPVITCVITGPLAGEQQYTSNVPGICKQYKPAHYVSDALHYHRTCKPHTISSQCITTTQLYIFTQHICLMSAFYMESSWNTHGILMAYSWNTHGIPMEHSWNTQAYSWSTHGIPMEYSWNTHGILMEYSRNTYGIPMEYSWNTYGIPMEYLWNTYGILMEYSWNTHGIPSMKVFHEYSISIP